MLKLHNKERNLMAKYEGWRLVMFHCRLSLRTIMYSEGKLSASYAIDEVKKVIANHVKKQPEFPWMNLLSSRVYQNALIDLQDALPNSLSSGQRARPKSGIHTCIQ